MGVYSGLTTLVAQSMYDCLYAMGFISLWEEKHWSCNIFKAVYFLAFTAVKMYMFISMVDARAVVIADSKPGNPLAIYNFMYQPGFFKIIQHPV